MRLGRIVLFFILFSSVSVVHASYVEYQEEWSIYEFDPESGETELIYSNPYEIIKIAIHPDGEIIAFSSNLGEGYDFSEVFTINRDGSGVSRLTENTNWDLYPQWSANGEEITFLSWRNSSLDIYRMDADGSNQRLLYDSGRHDSDVNVRGDLISFTLDSQIWVMDYAGSNPRQLTDPPRAGEWGNAVLPFGDYDPRISPDGSTIVFERMVDDSSPHGNYDMYLIDVDGSNERRLTMTGWTQGIATWSPDGENLIYLVSAKGTEGAYDIYRINPDGSDMTDLTYEHFEASFLVHSPVYSPDGSIYFVGQWYGWEKLESLISCTVLSSMVTLGETVSVSGTVQDIVHGIEYTMIVSKPDGTVFEEVIESSDGSYTYGLDADLLGDWTVQVEWAGNLGYYPSSNAVTFTVSEVKEETSGIPGFPMLSVLLGAITLFVFIKK